MSAMTAVAPASASPKSPPVAAAEARAVAPLPLTEDFVPLLPWLGVTLWGLAPVGLLCQRLAMRGPTRPKAAPCGSRAWRLYSPPGISCGPSSTWPPPALIFWIAASMSSTPM